VFHLTQLKKRMFVPENEVITEANAWIEPDFLLIEYPLRVLDLKERKTRRQTVRMYKIQWSHHTKEEATWETEEYLNTKYPGFLQSRNREFLLVTLDVLRNFCRVLQNSPKHLKIYLYESCPVC
jgi:hypothetical protein